MPESNAAAGNVNTHAIAMLRMVAHLQTASIRSHRSGHSRTEDVGGTDGQAEIVRSKDCGHCNEFGAGTLGVGEMFLADFFADGDDDALPADHGAESECKGDRHFDPARNELGGLVDLALVVGKRRSLMR